VRATTRIVVAWIWMIAPLGLLALHISQSMQTEFIRLSYYVVVWSSLLALAVCGFWFLIAGPGAKWLLRAAALLVALFVAINFLIAWDYGGAQGNHDLGLYSIMCAVVSFCALTAVVAGMQPNPSIQSGPAQAPAAD